MPDLNSLTIEDAASVLGLSVYALRARICRATRRPTEDGEAVDLGLGVTALLPHFARKWFIFIPHKTVLQMKKTKKKLGLAWGGA